MDPRRWKIIVGNSFHFIQPQGAKWRKGHRDEKREAGGGWVSPRINCRGEIITGLWTEGGRMKQMRW